MYSAHACIFLAVYDDTGVGLGKVIGTCLLLVGYFRRECYLIADDLIGPLGLYRYEYLGRKDELSVGCEFVGLLQLAVDRLEAAFKDPFLRLFRIGTAEEILY